MANPLSFFQLSRTPVLNPDGTLSPVWARWFATALVPAVNNTTPLTIPGPFANDAAAASNGVGLGQLYYVSGTVIHVRVV